MKAYTDLSQSKKLAKILPLESADMLYPSDFDFPFVWIEKPKKDKNATPCWSLAALLSVLKYPSLIQNVEEKWFVSEWTGKHHKVGGLYDNPIDACYEMILKLHELNLL